MSKAKVDFSKQADILSSLVKSASLQTTGSTSEVPNPARDTVALERVKKATRPKTLRAIPETYFDAHEKLRSDNKTSLDFTAYILEALREKLESDNAL
ncbi:TPA: molecular chaperone GroEL [Yersinia enterocolitica]|uniref:Molecular chaperone GroEL n=1 Tax=Yersinia enterocolitica TaxID=630 RepID=A0ABM9SJN0_YEREN|nr:hypothetical protein [Yersinia enterocolitica]AOF17116.1 hypothetical protein BB936_22065 [Yersinia enterocolitica]AOF17291.1 hypothetical protein BED34_00350 [Yersinia enterocolitica]AOF25404.1 hypothetical protein BED33_22430 [Yersinia enterocolitica]AOF29476.1 hypothetical protein BED32_22010 [Yersinia enterocolitica]AOF29544.1 hypothetical protein BED35_00230 [Yersinia enterocolitica]